MMECVCTSPTQTVRYDAVTRVTVPAYDGTMQFLPGHAEAFVALVSGNVVIERAGAHAPEMVQINESVCHVTPKSVTIMM